jgi:hypothetical protein
MTISFAISVSGKPVENEYPIELSIRPKRESIIWRQEVQPGDIQVAYLEAMPIVSHDAIEIVDCFSDTASEVDSIIYSTKAMSLLSEKDNLVFTTITNQAGSDENPMFYGHKVPKDVTTVSFLPWNKSSNPYIAFYNSTYNVVASDFSNTIDITSDSYNSSYVQYTTSSGLFSEIYRREPIFKEAEIYDLIDEDGNLISSSIFRPIYTRTRENNKWLYQFYKEQNQTIYYKEEMDTSPQLSIPKNLDLQFPWELDIIGETITYKKVVNDIQTFFYNLQGSKVVNYFPSYPYVLNKKEGIRINNNTFMVPNGNIEINKYKNIHLTYKVFRNQELIFAETTKPSLIGKRIAGSYVKKNIIRYSEFTGNYDPDNGVIVIANQSPIVAGDRISVEFHTKEKVGYRQLGNLNPLQNKKMLNGVLFYYITPKTEDIDSQVYWFQLEERYNPITSFFTLYLEDTDHLEMQAYVGDTFQSIVNSHFVFDPYSRENLLNNYNWMPLAFVKFKKEKYLDSAKHKDLRIFSDVKNDHLLDDRGRDFLFSSLLNKEGQVQVSLDKQAIVFVDKSEISNYSDYNSSTDMNVLTRERLKTTIKSNLAVDILPIYKNIDIPVIKKITMKKNDPNNYIVYVTLKKSKSIYTNIHLYQVLDGNYYSPADPLVSSAVLTEEIQLTNQDTIIAFPINGEALVNINEKTNIYFYLRLASSDESLVSPVSQIACVYCK